MVEAQGTASPAGKAVCNLASLRAEPCDREWTVSWVEQGFEFDPGLLLQLLMLRPFMAGCQRRCLAVGNSKAL